MRLILQYRPALAAAAAAMVAGTAAATPALDAERYRHCTRLADSDPAAAIELGGAWIESGGDGAAAARHCIALALVALGDYDVAAGGLQRLADDLAAMPERRLALLRQAGQAWLLAERPQPALAAFSDALALAPDDADLLIDRARAHAAGEAYWEAIDDLNRALEVAPDRDDALAYRASAYRMVEGFELAEADAERAVALNPSNVDALLERANIRSLLGADEDARRDWEAILAIDPDSPAADAARSNLGR